MRESCCWVLTTQLFFAVDQRQSVCSCKVYTHWTRPDVHRLIGHTTQCPTLRLDTGIMQPSTHLRLHKDRDQADYVNLYTYCYCTCSAAVSSLHACCTYSSAVICLPSHCHCDTPQCRASNSSLVGAEKDHGGGGVGQTCAGGGIVSRAPVGSAACAAGVAMTKAANATAGWAQALASSPTACTPQMLVSA